MQIIGLTGPTGAGKSTVSQMLAAHGFYIADGDRAARTVMTDGALLRQLAEAFGADVLRPDGSLDRKALAARAFATPQNTQTLNRLTHPAITQKLFADIAAHGDCPAAVIDAAALIESGLDRKCDLLAVVLAPEETRLTRILARDGLTRDEAMQRIRAQHPDTFYTDRADVVLYNDAQHDLRTEIQKILQRVSA